MKSLQQRIMETILQGTALSMVAACSNPEPKQPEPLIVEKQPVTVVEPAPKKVKHCGIELKPKVYDYPTTDPEDEYSTRKLVCLSFDEMSKQKLNCGTVTATEASTMLRTKFGYGRCGGFRLSTTPNVCGPVDVKGQGCCYAMNVRRRRCIIKGRPYIVEGMVRTTACARREGWWDEDVVMQWERLEALPEAVREQIAAKWATDGCHEHASIASFSSFLMDLLALGAPATLIAQATQAIADEIDHAARCFTIASAYAQMPLGPAELDTSSSTASRDIKQMLIAAIEEGCIGESCAAYEAQVAQLDTVHPYIRESLHIIAVDETEHALLAWAFVDWVLSEYPELLPVARDAFMASAMATEPTWLVGESLVQSHLRCHGVLSEAATRNLRVHAYQEIVMPCAQALFEKHEQRVDAVLEQI